MNEYVRVGIAAYLIGVCPETIRRWTNEGKMTCIRTVGGHRRIALIEIKRLLLGDGSDAPQKKMAVYARVSSHDQKKKGDLARQVKTAQDYCRKQGDGDPFLFTDVASGLKTDRPGLAKLCKQVAQGQIRSVVITYPDRLTRFGLEYLDRLFRRAGTTITALQQPPSQSVQEELVQDLIAIITSFSGRVHGLRSHKNKQVKSKEIKV